MTPKLTALFSSFSTANLASHHGMLLGHSTIYCGLLAASSQNPAFGPAQLKSFTPVFNQKASEVRNIWISQLNESDTDVIKVDVTSYMSRATLDIIGLTGRSTPTRKPIL